MSHFLIFQFFGQAPHFTNTTLSKGVGTSRPRIPDLNNHRAVGSCADGKGLPDDPLKTNRFFLPKLCVVTGGRGWELSLDALHRCDR